MPPVSPGMQSDLFCSENAVAGIAQTGADVSVAV